MKAIAALLGVTALSLAVVACAVLALGDRTVLVSPPDAVVEGFVRALQLRRFDQARSYLSRSATASSPDLRTRIERFERTAGRIENVHGRLLAIGRETARAIVEVKTANGRTTDVAFPLVREHWEWRIADLEGLPRAER
jgi:hypothetical protein